MRNTYDQAVSDAVQKTLRIVMLWQTLSSNLVSVEETQAKPRKHRSLLLWYHNAHQTEQVKHSGAELRKYVQEIKDKKTKPCACSGMSISNSN
ncbi:unnamed protein product [Arctia plantaginis]|uniref:Uncharacterized protein n=1 Tax=Arctia plantaginis TaxID=874455 RepID=A0A8S0ZR78_ARCPL|nr:unnamed protein product [Arctia plantaginis]CAB3250763.1 unnamed protein product [Arctia plantaginis]